MFRNYFRQSALTFESTAFQFKYPFSVIRNRHIILDFSLVSFIDPFGMLFLKYLLETLTLQNKVEIILKSRDVINYLVRMSFPAHFTGNQNLIFKPDLNQISLRTRDLSDQLIELISYPAENDDDVDHITEQIVEIVANRLPFYDDIEDSFQTAISEIISNTQVHSQRNQATVCLQTYGNSIIMALGDDGIGIRAGLRAHGEGLLDEEAIEKALEPLVSGRPGGGGMGLTELSEKIRMKNDCLGIRSGSGYILIENGVLRKGKCAGLPGTQIMIKLHKYQAANSM